MTNAALACRPSPEFYAPFVNLIKSSSLVSIGEITNLVDFYDPYGNRTQIASIKILKDLRGSSFSIFRITSSLVVSPVRKSSCNLHLNFKIGEKYLFTPNFKSPNAFEKIENIEKGTEYFKQLEIKSQSDSVLKVHDAIEFDLKSFTERLEGLVKKCENKNGCDPLVIAKFLSGTDAVILSSVESEAIGQLVFRFLSLDQVYLSSISLYHGEILLRIAISQRDALVRVSENKKKSENERLRKRIESLVRNEARKINSNGVDQTKEYFEKIK